MADLSLELTIKIIPISNASHKEVAPFLQCTEFVHNSIKAEEKPELI